MKFSTAFTTVLAIVPAITGASAGVVPRQNNQRKGGNNNPAVTDPQTSFSEFKHEPDSLLSRRLF